MNGSELSMRELSQKEIPLVGGAGASIRAIGSSGSYTQYEASCPTGQYITPQFNYTTETSNSVWDSTSDYSCTVGAGYNGIIWDQAWDGSLFYGWGGFTGM